MFEEMAEGLKMMEEVVQGNGDRREADEKFHMALFKGARNSVLQSFNEVLEGFFVRLRSEYAARVPGNQQWWEDHKAIYEALKKRDAVLAQALMRAHLNRYADYGVIPRT
jgi:DNA-binding FadR family transcriptional regulator